MYYPSLDEVKKLAENHTLIPIAMKAYADTETPISLFKRFQDSNYCFLLESVVGGEKWARYSFIGRNPFLILRSTGDRVTVENKNGEVQNLRGNPVEILKEQLKSYQSPKLDALPRFNGGAVGFFGYDVIRHYENLPHIQEDDLELPESHFMFTDEVIAYDHLEQKIQIIVNLHVDGNIERSYSSAVERIKEIYREIASTRYKVLKSCMTRNPNKKLSLNYTGNISKERYCENVKKAKDYIRNGDIFQVVLSQRLCAQTSQNPLDTYRALRMINPSPYMFYLKFNNYTIAGASPEMLVRVENGAVETCPIAGTRKRGDTPDSDTALEKELISDEKEKAEHMMLVDLARNDIGKVSEFGSVSVEGLMHVEKYSHVMHMVSNVKGRLRKDITAFDALMSVLPAGTLSGAPKVRAMEIIDELETTKRGIYGGAIGYLSFNGNLDSCITIRTFLFKDGRVYIQSGAGIVADSIPEMEYEESLNKARALLTALEEAGDMN